MYCYISLRPETWTVAFVTPRGLWIRESEFHVKGMAIRRVAFLNGKKQLTALEYHEQQQISREKASEARTQTSFQKYQNDLLEDEYNANLQQRIDEAELAAQVMLIDKQPSEAT